MNYSEYISIDPNIRFGRPCVNGTRITVYDILRWLASGMTVEEILDDYPELSDIQVRACLVFAADSASSLLRDYS